MAYGTKYQWTISGRERVWTIALQQEGHSGPGTFTTLYLSVENSAVGATNDFIAKVSRDESNVGSWTYSLLNLSQATYGGVHPEFGLAVDEAAGLIFIAFSPGDLWSFDLSGNPITHIWDPDGVDTIDGYAIDPENRLLYVMFHNDTGGSQRTSVLREYEYDGTSNGVIWTNLFAGATNCRSIAYDSGFVWFIRSTSTTTFDKVEVATGTLTTVATPVSISGLGQAVASLDLERYFAIDVGANDLYYYAIPTAGSKVTVDSEMSADGNGVAIDKVASKVYWTDDQRSIVRANFDGSGEENVIDLPASGAGTYIYGISLGEPTLAPTTILGHRTARIVWGETTGDLDSRILPADMRLQVLDPGYVLFNELSAAGVEEDDYQILVTDSEGEYTLRMRVRLDTVKTLLFTNLEVPVTELYAYCGLSNLKTLDAVVLSSSTAHNTARYLLASQTIGQNIEYISGVYPENVHSSGAVLNLWRLNRLDLMFQEQGRKRDNGESQLAGILETLDAALWNGFDGQWHLKHRFALGEYIAGRGPQRYIHASTSLVALSTLQLPSLNVDASTLTRGAMRHIEAPVQAVEIEQGPDVENRFVNVNLVKYGDFEQGWVSGTEHIVWEGASTIVERSTDSDTGTYALQINAVSPATVTQNLGYFSGGQPIRFNIVLRFGHELTSGGSGGSVSSKVRLVFDPYDAAEAAYYATASGWTTTPTDYNMTDTANAFGSGVSYQDLNIEVPDSLPSLDGLLYLQFTGDVTGNWVVRLDSVEVRLVDEGYATAQTYKAVFHRLQNNTNPATKGGVVRQRRVWFPGTLWVDTDNNTIRDLSVPMIQANTDGASAWRESGYWTSEIEGDIATYDDVARWSAESRIGQQQDPLEIIEGEVLGIVSPEVALIYSNSYYVPLYCDVDLATEVTRFVAAKKQRPYTDLVPPDLFETMYVALQNNAVGATNNFVAKVIRDEDNVGSWNYSLVNISKATYGEFSSELAVVVDEAASLMFVVFAAGDVWSFSLNGTPVTHIWDPDGVNTISGVALDSINDKLYIMLTNDTGGSQRTSVLREYEYDGTNNGAIWSNLFAGATICRSVAYDDGFVWFIRNTSTSTFDKIAVSTGTLTTVATPVTLNGGGQAVASVELGRYYAIDNGDNDLYYFAIPTAGSKTTVDSAISADENGVAIDRAASKIYWPDAQRSIVRANLDGSSEQNVIDFPGTGAGTYIYGISLGR